MVDTHGKLTMKESGKFIQPLGSKHLGFGVWGLDDADQRGEHLGVPF